MSRFSDYFQHNKEKNQSRLNDINELNRDIDDMANMQDSISGMIEEQGIYVDDIESNIDRSHVNVNTGNTELREASKSEEGASKCAIIYLIIVIMGGTIFTLLTCMKVKLI
jgi:t-SNARE complex subunit (syntaxin)